MGMDFSFVSRLSFAWMMMEAGDNGRDFATRRSICSRVGYWQVGTLSVARSGGAYIARSFHAYKDDGD
jgi:hypothetical protein